MINLNFDDNNTSNDQNNDIAVGAVVLTTAPQCTCLTDVGLLWVMALGVMAELRSKPDSGLYGRDDINRTDMGSHIAKHRRRRNLAFSPHCLQCQGSLNKSFVR